MKLLESKPYNSGLSKQLYQSLKRYESENTIVIQFENTKQTETILIGENDTVQINDAYLIHNDENGTTIIDADMYIVIKIRYLWEISE